MSIWGASACRYSLDPKAREWCDQLAKHPEYEQLHPSGKMFLALPFMHEESMAGQEVRNVSCSGFTTKVHTLNIIHPSVHPSVLLRTSQRGVMITEQALAALSFTHCSARTAHLRSNACTLACPWHRSQLRQRLAHMQKCLRMLKAEAERLRSKFGEECASTKAISGSAQYSQQHLDIIQKWGRFPHRNELLGRESTDAERQGLQDGSIESF